MPTTKVLCSAAAFVSSFRIAAASSSSSSVLLSAFVHTTQKKRGLCTNLRGGSGGSNDGSSAETATAEAMATALPVPPLRYLGDAQLMQPQPPVVVNLLMSEKSQESSSSLLLMKQLDMLERAMHQYGGIGIAAPQVGWWKRVFCFGIQDGNNRYPAAGRIPFSIWINPEITWTSSNNNETNWMWEGCLSVPGMRGWVERPAQVKMKGWNENGELREEHLTGLAARVAQHELDHLNGILFPMRVPSAKFLVSQAMMDARDGWAEDWPSPGSHKTLLGELSNEK